MDGKALIDKARALGYADSQTAAIVGVNQSYLTDVYAGRKRISPETAALLADLVGEDGPDVAHRLMVEYEKNPARKTALARVLFSLAGCCVVLGLQMLVNNDASALTLTSASVYTLCAVIAALALLLGLIMARGHRASVPA